MFNTCDDLSEQPHQNNIGEMKDTIVLLQNSTTIDDLRRLTYCKCDGRVSCTAMFTQITQSISVLYWFISKVQSKAYCMRLIKY